MCRYCTDPTVLAAAKARLQQSKTDPDAAARRAAKQSENMRRLWQDPAFAAAGVERMARVNADPCFRAAQRAAMQRKLADPAFTAKRIAAARAAADRRRGYHLPPELVKTVAKWKRQGLTPGQIKAAVVRIVGKGDIS